MLSAITFFLLAGVMLISAVLVNYRSVSQAWLNESFGTYLDTLWTSHREMPARLEYEMWQKSRAIAGADSSEAGKPMVNLDLAAKQMQFSRQWRVGLVTVLVLAAELAWGFYHEMRTGFRLPQVSSAPEAAGNTQAIGLALYRNYMLPVEIASILLLVAMVGAVVMAKKKLD